MRPLNQETNYMQQDNTRIKHASGNTDINLFSKQSVINQQLLEYNTRRQALCFEYTTFKYHIDCLHAYLLHTVNIRSQYTNQDILWSIPKKYLFGKKMLLLVTFVREKTILDWLVLSLQLARFKETRICNVQQKSKVNVRTHASEFYSKLLSPSPQCFFFHNHSETRTLLLYLV